MSKYKKKFLHIIFKGTNCIDYIYPYYFKKTKYDKHSLDFLIWDPNYNKIKKNLPINFHKFNVLNISQFTKIPQVLKIKKNFLKIFQNFFDYKIFFKYRKLEKYLSKFDKVFLDCKSFENLFFKKTIFDIIQKNKITIYYVPHGPHYRSSHEEIADSNLSVNFDYKLILSNKKSNPWKTKNINKQKCKYIGFPASNKLWRYQIKNLKQRYKKNQTIGFLFRPFIKKKNRKQLINSDYYINSYEENLFMINLSKKLFLNGYNILYRLHPSTLETDFLDNYCENLKKFSFDFSYGSIHNFMTQAHTIVSFHSTSLIYGAFYKNEIFLFENDLQKKIYSKWPKLKYIYNSFTKNFDSEKKFGLIFNNKSKNNKTKFQKFRLNEIW